MSLLIKLRLAKGITIIYNKSEIFYSLRKSILSHSSLLILTTCTFLMHYKSPDLYLSIAIATLHFFMTVFISLDEFHFTVWVLQKVRNLQRNWKRKSALISDMCHIMRLNDSSSKWSGHQFLHFRHFVLLLYERDLLLCNCGLLICNCSLLSCNGGLVLHDFVL